MLLATVISHHLLSLTCAAAPPLVSMIEPTRYSSGASVGPIQQQDHMRCSEKKICAVSR
jgi:hypothetical protein